MTLTDTILKYGLPQAHALKQQNREQSAGVIDCLKENPGDTGGALVLGTLNLAALVVCAGSFTYAAMKGETGTAALMFGSGVAYNSILGTMAYDVAVHAQHKAFSYSSPGTEM